MTTQLRILFLITISNYIVQIPYNLYLYHSLTFNPKGILLLGVTFLLFIIPYIFLQQKKKGGYEGMLVFLGIEFLFYLLNIIGGIVGGYGWFFQLRNPNPLLFVVFLVGYINFLAAGFFLFYFVKNRKFYR